VVLAATRLMIACWCRPPRLRPRSRHRPGVPASASSPCGAGAQSQTRSALTPELDRRLLVVTTFAIDATIQRV
jgi:hypothetical protein